jgi:selenocysteine lyase/cysteine desulfurase
MFESEFCLDESIIHLNHAAVSPWPRCTAKAVKSFADENASLGSRHYPDWVKTEQDLKEQLRLLINARSVDEIALLKNTSEALSTVAYGLSWQRGDNVVITGQEFPSNRIVWESLVKYGVATRPADLESGDSPEAAVLACIDGNTRLVAVSSVQYGTGLRLDLERIGGHCRERGILFCVDAIQSLGAIELDVQACHADFVMADAHKWMLGPEGIALFYCRNEVMERLDLKQYGWHMVEDPGNYDRRDWAMAPSARRFECGSPNMTGVHALHASLSLLHGVGMPTIQKLVMENSAYLIEQLTRRDGYCLITPPETARHAGIVTFAPLKETPEKLHARLLECNVLCAVRAGGIRFSPHFYTPREKLDQALDLLAG